MTAKKQPLQLYTIGHATRPLDSFIAILKSFDIDMVVDIRTIPRSRHNPQYNKDTLPQELEKEGIKYTHMTGLGGLRKAQANSINLGWHNLSFRNYADYMQSDDFKENLKQLIDIIKENNVVIMCAETLPWRCHRSLVADALLIRGIKSLDIFKEGVAKEHELTSFAVVKGKDITYPTDERVTEDKESSL